MPEAAWRWHAHCRGRTGRADSDGLVVACSEGRAFPGSFGTSAAVIGRVMAPVGTPLQSVDGHTSHKGSHWVLRFSLSKPWWNSIRRSPGCRLSSIFMLRLQILLVTQVV